MKIALIISDFNKEITSKMEKTAEKVAASLGAKVVKKIHVPGAFEIPFAVKSLLEGKKISTMAASRKKIDAIAALGAVIQGDTQHDIVIVNSIAQKLIELSLQYNKPIGFGIIGPRVTWQQAEKRALEYSKRAVKAALELTKIK